jgi:hypothetical protein
MGIIEQFDGNGKISFCPHVVFRFPKVPAAHWRHGTRKLLLRAGTYDARTADKWETVGRKIKAGAGPIMTRVNKGRVAGRTKRVPFYKVEDTIGRRLDYKPIKPPKFPFLEKAHEWGLTIKAFPWGFNLLGRYIHDERKILLATPDTKVFYHELAHAAQCRLGKNLDRIAIPGQEILSELAACGLYSLSVRKPDIRLGNSFMYIALNAVHYEMTPVEACKKFLKKTEAILEHILE